MRHCSFEHHAESLEPLSLTRPIFDLRCGIGTLAQKQLRHVSAHDWGALVRPSLEDLYRLQHPDVPVNDPDWLRTEDLILCNGRWLPPPERFTMPAVSCVGMVGADVAFVVLRKNESAAFSFEQLPLMLDHWQQALPGIQAGGRLISYLWDLVDQNGSEIQRDFIALHGSRPSPGHPSLTVSGPHDQVWVASSARIEPFAVADTTHGPVIIDEHAVISAFSRLEGPCYIGPKSQVCGARVRAGTTLGPECRVGGEVEASILHGYSNKYHDGFLGHSYVGEWVNLGAGTHNSDLRNDYGEVSIILRGVPVRTGLNKVGCFFGDHTKTGLGTLLNTGTNVGAFCNVLPSGRFAPKYVPSFASWWNGTLSEAVTLDQSLATARIAMQRRGVTLTAAHRALYSWLFEDTRQERRRALRESEQRQMRRSA